MAKPNKKQKINKPVEEPKTVEPTQYATTETLHQESEAVMDDPLQRITPSLKMPRTLIQKMISRPAMLNRLMNLMI